MYVYDCKLGRLGNAIFRYFASSLFCIFYNAERRYEQQDCNMICTDDYFIEWSTNVLQTDTIPPLDNNLSFMFYGYYQHDNIFLKYKQELKDWIITHPDELLYTDGNDGILTYYNYEQVSYKSIYLLVNPYMAKIYDIVVHLRLEDFVNNNTVIHPESINNVLKQIITSDNMNQQICLVVNTPTTEIENKYVDYFRQQYNIILESNSVIEDYHIMRNATTLVCSCSTLSWIAPFLSDRVTTVYFPNYKNTRIHETFKKPIENTILYDFNICSKVELQNFLNMYNVNTTPIQINNNMTIKHDPYCAVNCKKEPITKRIIEYIGNIENGFYIEAGAYDGVLQSNTKFLEEEYNWSGILVEPSPNIFLSLQQNRPNNININKCLVDKTHTASTIQGAFDNGPMSSVGNRRNLENVELINVDCDNLENILDYLEITKIDFMSLDTEGYEFQVLKGLNLEKHRPTYLLIQIYESDKETIFNYLEAHNYLFLENISNYNYYDNVGWDGSHNDYLFKSL
jgi:FkbM family methyltransferase